MKKIMIVLFSLSLYFCESNANALTWEEFKQRVTGCFGGLCSSSPCCTRAPRSPSQPPPALPADQPQHSCNLVPAQEKADQLHQLVINVGENPAKAAVGIVRRGPGLISTLVGQLMTSGYGIQASDVESSGRHFVILLNRLVSFRVNNLMLLTVAKAKKDSKAFEMLEIVGNQIVAPLQNILSDQGWQFSKTYEDFTAKEPPGELELFQKKVDELERELTSPGGKMALLAATNPAIFEDGDERTRNDESSTRVEGNWPGEASVSGGEHLQEAADSGAQLVHSDSGAVASVPPEPLAAPRSLSFQQSSVDTSPSGAAASPGGSTAATSSAAAPSASGQVTTSTGGSAADASAQPTASGQTVNEETVSATESAGAPSHQASS